LAGVGILLVGLWYLQVISAKRYVQSQQVQCLRKVRLPALRGAILDRHGYVLAENRPSFNVNLYLEELSKLFQQQYVRELAKWQAAPQDKLTLWDRLFNRRRANTPRKLTRTEREKLGWQARYAVVSNLVEQLGLLLQQPVGFDQGRFSRHYTNRLVLPLPIIEGLSPRQVAIFHEQPKKLPGLNLDIQPLRHYPNGTLAAHLLGQVHRVENFQGEDEIECLYCLPDYEGRVGAEGAFDQELRGRAGISIVRVNNLGYRQSESVWLPAEPGHNLVLTIDLRIQQAAEQALRSLGNAAKGAVVVLDPRNGDVLALTSAPTYDPNLFLPRMTNQTWLKLNDPELNPTFNRATFGAYAPGSVLKIIVGLAALEAGDLNPNEIYQSKGFYQLGRKTFDDQAGPGDFDFRRALKRSSNPYFIHYGLKTGLTNIMNLGRRCFFGQRTRIPLLQEVGGFFPTPEWVRQLKQRGEPIQPGDIANLSIGQGYVAVTPLQMALVTAAIANGGKIFWPRLVDRIEPRQANNNGLLRVFPPAQLRAELGVQPQNLALVREGMLADVEEADGTGHRAAVAGWRVGGKTGTAEVKHPVEGKRKDTWFVSFAPYENPRYVVVVLVENGVSGGATCAPIAQKIHQAIKRLDDTPPPGRGLLVQRQAP
jgi:penicillin-binding protein 2